MISKYDISFMSKYEGKVIRTLVSYIVVLFYTIVSSQSLYAANAAESDSAILKKYLPVCSTCHGGAGREALKGTPILDGFNKVYLVKQLEDFKQGRRSSKEMNEIAQSISNNKAIELLADYYASRKFTPSKQQEIKLNPKMIALGKDIFIGKRLDYGIPACTTCHGKNGMGGANGKYPRIVGQPRDYFIKQMKQFRSKERNNDSPPMMQNIVMVMDDEDIESVAQYIASLP